LGAVEFSAMRHPKREGPAILERAGQNGAHFQTGLGKVVDAS